MSERICGREPGHRRAATPVAQPQLQTLPFLSNARPTEHVLVFIRFLYSTGGSSFLYMICYPFRTSGFRLLFARLGYEGFDALVSDFLEARC